jgi:hypothetical protein
MALGLVGSARPGDEPQAALPRPRAFKSAARLANADQVRKQFGLVPEYDNVAGLNSLKIAILDYGFDGLGGNRQYLPENTVVVEHYDPALIQRFHLGDPEYRKSFAPGNSHGRTMAQIIWAVTGFSPQGPKFYLLNANGPTMLRRAVRYAIEAKVDIILFSGIFEGGGNGDGRGAINRIVADALAANIIWINAAGNYGNHVYNGSVDIQPDGYLRLGNRSDATALRFRNLLDENTVTVTLTWNDYHDTEDAGTTKDLDLYVEDWQGKQLGASEKVQVPGNRNPGPEESRNPRERVVLTDLPAASNREYRIRIKAKKGTFTAEDRIRVLLTSGREAFLDAESGMPTDALRFVDASAKGEIYPPADNPLVLTVGEDSPSSSMGPTADHRVKPDVVLEESRAFFSNGDVTSGASNAAAYFAGIVAVLKAAEPRLTTRHLLWFAHYGPATTTTAPSQPIVTNSRVAPRGRILIQRVRQAANDGRLRTLLPQAPGSYGRTSYSFQPERLPPPTPVTATSQTAKARRLWRTPTRQELAEEIRADR